MRDAEVNNQEPPMKIEWEKKRHNRKSRQAGQRSEEEQNAMAQEEKPSRPALKTRKRRGNVSSPSWPAPRPEEETPAKSMSLNESFRKEVFEFFFEHVCRKRPIGLKRLMDEIEKNIIRRILGDAEGNQKAAASALGLNYTTLNAKVRKHRLQSSPIESSEAVPDPS
jgi:DNA-binding protein Fis